MGTTLEAYEEADRVACERIKQLSENLSEEEFACFLEHIEREPTPLVRHNGVMLRKLLLRKGMASYMVCQNCDSSKYQKLPFDGRLQEDVTDVSFQNDVLYFENKMRPQDSPIREHLVRRGITAIKECKRCVKMSSYLARKGLGAVTCSSQEISEHVQESILEYVRKR